MKKISFFRSFFVICSFMAYVFGSFSYAGIDITLPQHLKSYRGGFKNIGVDEIEEIRLIDHTKRSEIIFLANVKGNYDFIQEIKKIIKSINEVNSELPPTKLAILQKESFNNPLIEEDDTLVFLNLPDFDMWLRDFGKIVVVKRRGSLREEYAVLDFNRGLGLAEFGQKLAQSLDIAYIPLSIDKNRGNFGGNIEVTPNGILYIGNTAATDLIEIFKNRSYQNSLITLDTSWLLVGHVDEYISTIRLSTNEDQNEHDPCGFALVIASPLLALDLIKNNLATQKRDLDVFNKEEIPLKLKAQFKRYSETLKLMQNHLSGVAPLVKPNFSEAYTLLETQGLIHNIIKNNVDELKDIIIKKNPSCKGIKVIEYPVLFKCGYIAPKRQVNSCQSFLPNPVNMMVMNKHLLIPDTFYPPFKKYIEKELIRKGQTPHFLDDMMYHLMGGNIHCGTNCLNAVEP